jgi:hypothetical protein
MNFTLENRISFSLPREIDGTIRLVVRLFHEHSLTCDRSQGEFMAFFRHDFTSAFSLDRIEVQETARRQFFISAVVVAAILGLATVASVRETMTPAYKPAQATGRDSYLPSSIKTHVRYVDRSVSAHRIAIASTEN